MNSSQYVGPKRTRRAEAVDSQGVVVPVLIRPLAVVDKAWRYGIQVEVSNRV